ncbi:MAG: WYL domain-containing protein, partial [Clostridia bacterium]|nr:WYL domain-containing protein [Clostridia bacterium]
SSAASDVYKRQPMEDLKIDESWETYVMPSEVELLFDRELYGLVSEWFENVVREEDGRVRVNVTLPENEWCYGYILSFGPGVEVVKPLHLRQKIKEMATSIAAKNA